MDRSTTAADARRAMPVSDPPAIPGLRFRAYRGEDDDIPEMARVVQAQWDADAVEETTTVESMRNEYRNLTNSDPYHDLLLAEVEGRLVAFGRAAWIDVSWGGRSYDSRVYMDPAFRRRGLGRAMLRSLESRLREIAAGHDVEGDRFFGAWRWDTDVGHRVLMEQEAYVPVRRFFDMVRPGLERIEVPPLPHGLEIRPVGQELLRTVFDADTEAFRDHFGGVDGSDAAFRRWIDDPDTDPSLWLVAWDGDEVAGGVLNGIYPSDNARHGFERGWLDSVFTRRPWRRRGLARALIGRSLVLLRERGMTEAALGVDAENPNEALGLYSDAGFRVHRSSTAYRKPLEPGGGIGMSGRDLPASVGATDG